MSRGERGVTGIRTSSILMGRSSMCTIPTLTWRGAAETTAHICAWIAGGRERDQDRRRSALDLRHATGQLLSPATVRHSRAEDLSARE
jgi:hypothetical protein